MRYVFGDCTLDTEYYELHRAGVRIPVRPKVFQLLAYLIAHRDRVVMKDEMIAYLWPQQFVGDAALKSCLMTARKGWETRRAASGSFRRGTAMAIALWRW
jgi:DNA-binding winged helix-turn-helix (wHTH) protein